MTKVEHVDIVSSRNMRAVRSVVCSGEWLERLQNTPPRLRYIKLLLPWSRSHEVPAVLYSHSR